VTFAPRPVPGTIDKTAQAYLADEFRRVRDALDVVEQINFKERNAEPSKLFDGIVLYADGTNWNPGQGEGIYARVGGAWESLVGLQPDENETISGNWTFDGTVALNGVTTIADDITLFFGTDQDVGIVYDETTDDRGEFIGDWTFTSNTGFNVEGSGPRWAMFENNASVDEGGWAWYGNGGILSLRATTDAQHPAVTGSDDIINIRRSGAVGTSVDFECPVVIDYASDGNAKLSIGDGTESDGAVLISLGFDRAWQVRQGASGSSTRFDLYSTTNKILRIGGDTNGVLADFNTGRNFLEFPDNNGISFGSDDDFDIYWDGNSLDFDPAVANDQVNFLTGTQIQFWDDTDTDHGELQHTGGRARLWSNNDPILLYNNARGWQLNQIVGSVADDGTATVSMPGDGGFVFIVAQTTSACETGQSGGFFYFSGTAMFDIGTGANWSLGSGSNPDVDTNHNVWRSADSVLSIKNRRGSARYYQVFIIGGVT
jgi:hypothetical protein